MSSKRIVCVVLVAVVCLIGAYLLLWLITDTFGVKAIKERYVWSFDNNEPFRKHREVEWTKDYWESAQNMPAFSYMMTCYAPCPFVVSTSYRCHHSYGSSRAGGGVNWWFFGHHGHFKNAPDWIKGGCVYKTVNDAYDEEVSTITDAMELSEFLALVIRIMDREIEYDAKQVAGITVQVPQTMASPWWDTVDETLDEVGFRLVKDEYVEDRYIVRRKE